MVEFSNRVLLISLSHGYEFCYLCGLKQSFWNLNVCETLRGSCQDADSVSINLAWIWKSVFLICSQGSPLLLIQGPHFKQQGLKDQRYLALFRSKKSLSLDLGLEPLSVKSGANCSSISLRKISYCICESRCQFWVFHKLWLLLRISQLGDMITDNFSERNNLRWMVSILIFTKRCACLLLTQKALCSRVAPFWWNSWCQRWVCKPC